PLRSRRCSRRAGFKLALEGCRERQLTRSSRTPPAALARSSAMIAHTVPRRRGIDVFEAVRDGASWKRETGLKPASFRREVTQASVVPMISSESLAQVRIL